MDIRHIRSRRHGRSPLRQALGAAIVALALAAPSAAAASPEAAAAPSAAAASPEASGASSSVPEHWIGVRVVDGVGEFFDRRTGGLFVPRGADYVFLPGKSGPAAVQLFRVGVYDPALTRSDFSDLAAQGFNTVRVFLDHCGSGPGCIGDTDGEGILPEYLDNVADLVDAAAEAGLVVLLTSNDLPDDGGYSQQANEVAGETFAGYRNAFYLTPAAVDATRRYWHDIVSGLQARGAATNAVLGWQLVNEQWMFQDQPPLSLTDGLVSTTTGTYDMGDPEAKARMVSDGLVQYIAQVRREILDLDPTALVTMGWFLPGVAPGWYNETASMIERSDLDFIDFHAYPGPLSIRDHALAFGMLDDQAKPVVMGELGAFRHRYSSIDAAARAVTAWVADSCDVGFDGWLYWTHRPAGPEVDDRTWGLTDEGGVLGDLLSPRLHPDPCATVEVPDANLAHDRPVRTSAALPGEPGGQAVDDDAATQWGSGSDPVQWIEVRLDGSALVAEIRLLVAQYPAGPTRHRIAVRRRGSGTLDTVHVFSRRTTDGDWLVYRPSKPLRDITAVRITTLRSPSWVAWREVVVLRS